MNCFRKRRPGETSGCAGAAPAPGGTAEAGGPRARLGRRTIPWLLCSLFAIALPGPLRSSPSSPSRLTTDGKRKQDLAWSPDGATLACSYYHTTGRIGIGLFDDRGRLLRNLSTDPVEMSPGWSPDGRRLVFVHVTHSGTDGELDLHQMDREGKERKPLVEARKSFEMAPSWSPDGSRLLFTTTRDRTQEIYVSRADGTEPRRLTSDPALKQHPCWSPDGKRIAFNSNQEGDFDIYVMDADGKNVRRVVQHPGIDAWPAWSPDGRRLAFVSWREGNPEIYVANGDGSEPRNVSRSPGFDDCPAWKPDGRTLTWVSDRDGGYDVYAVEP